ncbi:MAG: PilN domain-containing protein [Phycisphaerae bacterium]
MVAINLIPASVQLSLARQCHVRRWVIVFGASAALVLIAIGYNWSRLARAAEMREQSALLAAELGALRAEIDAVTAESNQVLLRIQRAKALRSKRAWSGVLALIGSCMPERCWLTSVATDPQRPSAQSARGTTMRGGLRDDDSQSAITIDAPRALRIAGYAPKPAEPHVFVANLKRTGAFTDVIMARSQREPVFDGSYYRFELRCAW